MVSSVAYAPDEILLALALGGALTLWLSPVIGIAVAVVIVVLVLCFRLNISAYPGGGGDYEIASKNLGVKAGLLVASALLVDYVLTLAVSLTVFADYFTAAFPVLAPFPVEVAIVGIAVVTFIGVRGWRGIRTLIALPTYLFLAAVLTTIVVGVIRVASGDVLGTEEAAATAQTQAATPAHALALVFIVLRAFSSGSVAVAGIETVSSAVPRFAAPRAKNAANTLLFTGITSAVMLVGLTWLAVQTHVSASFASASSGDAPTVATQSPVLGQVASAVFDGLPVIPFIILLLTALVLVAAGNTAVEGFPGLTYRLARDGFAPRQLATIGGRLTFSNGILVLAGAAVVLVFVTQARVTVLIDVYLVGVFLSFALGQLGMIRHWSKRIRRMVSSPARRSMQLRRVVNAVGFAIVTLVLAAVLVTKITHGAWITVLVIAALYALMGAVHRHYGRVDRELHADEDDRTARTLPPNTHAVVIVTGTHKPVLRALAFARATRPTKLSAVAVAVDEGASVQVQKRWQRMAIPVPLTVLDSPYRQLTRPVMKYIARLRSLAPHDLIVVYIPQYIVGRWWENLLHNQSVLRLKARLLFVPNVVVAIVPWRLKSFERNREQLIARTNDMDEDVWGAIS